MEGVSSKLKNWWQQKNSSKPEPVVATVSEEILHLFRLRREHRLLQARFSGVEDVFQTLLLEVDLEQNRLLLDEPFPHRFPVQGWVGRRIKVATSEGGLATRFESRVCDIIETDRVSALVLDMPRDIMAAQRRNHFRVTVNQGMPVDAVVRVTGQGNLAATVLDLSASGIRFAIPGEFQLLEEDTRLCLRLGSEAPMVSLLSVRSLMPSPQLDEATEVGAMLSGLNSSQVKTIERFLVRIQRMQRQRELEAGLA